MDASAVETIINKIAEYERSIEGIKDSYNFAQNPDVIQPAMLPCVIHTPVSFELDMQAHYNIWRTQWVYRSVLFVAPATSMGGTLKYLENAAIPFGGKWIAKFTDDAVIRSLLQTQTGNVTTFLEEGQYGAGGPLLTYADTPYIGWIFTYRFRTVA